MQTTNYIYFFSHKPNSINTHIYSQWWQCNIVDKVNNIDHTFVSAEQLMMYKKAILFKDYETANLILKSNNQAEIKKLGRKVSNFNSSVWDKHKFNIVTKGNLLKFSQNKDLKKALLSTKDNILVEASPYDKVWGIGLDASQAAITDPSEWPGENLLGKALMEVRAKLSTSE